MNGVWDTIYNQSLNSNDEIILTGLTTGVFDSVQVIDDKSCGSNYGTIILSGAACPEICNNGFDDDEDGLSDCNDPDCIVIPIISLSEDTVCVQEVFTVFADSDTGAGMTYTWDFGSGASPAVGTGIGPHSVSYSNCGISTISLTVERNGCVETIDTTIVIFDDEDPVWHTLPQDLIMECQPSAVYADSISLWLSNYGNGIASDNCNVLAINNDYSGLPPGCGNTGNTLVTFTAIDSCGNLAIATANIRILDTQNPEIEPVADITIDCESIPVATTPNVVDSCDNSPTIEYNEVIVQHPNANWKNNSSCSILYTVSDGIYDDKGTGTVTDDEMSFVLTVISQNSSAQWSANIAGNAFSGAYYHSIPIGPILSNGSFVNFIISDNLNASCSSSVTVNAANF